MSSSSFSSSSSSSFSRVGSLSSAHLLGHLVVSPLPGNLLHCLATVQSRLQQQPDDIFGDRCVPQGGGPSGPKGPPTPPRLHPFPHNGTVVQERSPPRKKAPPPPQNTARDPEEGPDEDEVRRHPEEVQMTGQEDELWRHNGLTLLFYFILLPTSSWVCGVNFFFLTGKIIMTSENVHPLSSTSLTLLSSPSPSF